MWGDWVVMAIEKMRKSNIKKAFTIIYFLSWLIINSQTLFCSILLTVGLNGIGGTTINCGEGGSIMLCAAYII